jgi:hypothetical protein
MRKTLGHYLTVGDHRGTLGEVHALLACEPSAWPSRRPGLDWRMAIRGLVQARADLRKHTGLGFARGPYTRRFRRLTDAVLAWERLLIDWPREQTGDAFWGDWVRMVVDLTGDSGVDTSEEGGD